MATWLIIAAERRELAGILKRSGIGKNLGWPGGTGNRSAQFAVELKWKGDRWLLVANGPGTNLVDEALRERMEVNGIVSTGFCGALDPALRIGDIVIDSASTLPRASKPQARVAKIVSMDRVAVTSTEKLALREKTGAAAVEMEAAAVSRKAAEWNVPFYSIRAVSDVAQENMPLDFNLYRDKDGRFSRSRIALAAMARPFSAIPALLRLNRHCEMAAESLGDFFADCQL
jgi:adenosylhomocysteine nucleosidase